MKRNKILSIVLIVLTAFSMTMCDNDPDDVDLIFGGFHYTKSDGKITITGYIGTSNSVTIPPNIKGKPVTAIGDGAFSGHYDKPNQLTSVIIPNSVTTIGEEAFFLNQLTSVTIPNSVTTIGSGAFRSNQLTSVTIGNSVTTIGGFAFYDNQLTSVTIGANVYLGDYSFNYNFETAYTTNGKQAGTYTRPNTNSLTWTKQ